MTGALINEQYFLFTVKKQPGQRRDKFQINILLFLFTKLLHGIKFYMRIHNTTLAERVLTVGIVDTETAVIRQQEKLRRFVVVSKPQHGYITELKKKRPRKTQVPQLLTTGEKKENFE